jgi:hypothetical protein
MGVHNGAQSQSKQAQVYNLTQGSQLCVFIAALLAIFENTVNDLCRFRPTR